MAEALCGPSNPLQNLQKHAGVNRSLQQDRLTYGQPLNQGFRSTPVHGAGHLDAEFQAFQAGYPSSGSFQEPSPLYTQGPFAGSSSQQLDGWASDFQRLDLNDTRSTPIPPSQFRREAPLQRHTPGGWHQEFVQQHNQQVSLPYSVSQTRERNTWLSQHLYQPFADDLAPVGYLSPTAQQKQRENYAENVFDEAAFEKAFDAAKMEVSYSGEHETTINDPQIESQGIEEDIKSWWASDPLLKPRGGAEISDSSEHLLQSIIAHQKARLEQSDSDTLIGPNQSYQPRIGSDTILDESSKSQEEHTPYCEADELARTAGQLLDNLKHEQSQKFQDSTFLALMRQLRDKEVRVEDDQMVDVSETLTFKHYIRVATIIHSTLYHHSLHQYRESTVLRIMQIIKSIRRKAAEAGRVLIKTLKHMNVWKYRAQAAAAFRHEDDSPIDFRRLIDERSRGEDTYYLETTYRAGRMVDMALEQEDQMFYGRAIESFNVVLHILQFMIAIEDQPTGRAALERIRRDILQRIQDIQAHSLALAA
ncbi:hypothetical protein MMC13_007664 [Lambiella insularis]|nr:hypothetical protein [Lambiella insularis]